MTLPVDLILDLHQDGLRLHLNTGHGEALRLTGPEGEGVSIPAKQVALLAAWCRLAAELLAQRQQGARPVVVDGAAPDTAKRPAQP